MRFASAKNETADKEGNNTRRKCKGEKNYHQFFRNGSLWVQINFRRKLYSHLILNNLKPVSKY